MKTRARQIGIGTLRVVCGVVGLGCLVWLAISQEPLSTVGVVLSRLGFLSLEG